MSVSAEKGLKLVPDPSEFCSELCSNPSLLQVGTEEPLGPSVKEEPNWFPQRWPMRGQSSRRLPQQTTLALPGKNG